MPDFSFLSPLCQPFPDTKIQDEVFVLQTRDRFGPYLAAWYYRKSVFLGMRTFTYSGRLIATIRLTGKGIATTHAKGAADEHSL